MYRQNYSQGKPMQAVTIGDMRKQINYKMCRSSSANCSHQKENRIVIEQSSSIKKSRAQSIQSLEHELRSKQIEQYKCQISTMKQRIKKLQQSEIKIQPAKIALEQEVCYLKQKLQQANRKILILENQKCKDRKQRVCKKCNIKITAEIQQFNETQQVFEKVRIQEMKSGKQGIKISQYEEIIQNLKKELQFMSKTNKELKDSYEIVKLKLEELEQNSSNMQLGLLGQKQDKSQLTAWLQKQLQEVHKQWDTDHNSLLEQIQTLKHRLEQQSFKGHQKLKQFRVIEIKLKKEAEQLRRKLSQSQNIINEKESQIKNIIEKQNLRKEKEEQKIKELQKKNKSFQKSDEQSKTKIKKLQKKLEEMDEQLEGYVEKINQSGERVSNLTYQLNEKEKIINSIIKESEKNKKQFDRQILRIKFDHEKQITEFKEQITTQQQCLSKKQNELASISLTLDNKNSQISEFLTERQKYEHQIKLLGQQIDNQKVHISSLSTLLEETKDINENNLNLLEEVRKQLKQKNQQNEQLKDMLEDKRTSQIREKEQIDHSLRHQQLESSTLKTKLAQQKQKNEKNEQIIESLHLHIEQIETEIQTFKQNSIHQSQQLKQSQQLQQINKKQLAILQNSYQTICEELQAHRNRIKQLQLSGEEMMKQIEEGKRELVDKNEEIAEYEEQLKRWRGYREQNKSEFQEYRLENRKMKGLLIQKQQQLNRLLKKSQQAQQQHLKTISSVKQTHQIELDSLTSSLQQQLASCHEEIQSLTNKNKQLSQKLHSSEISIKKLTTENSNLSFRVQIEGEKCLNQQQKLVNIKKLHEEKMIEFSDMMDSLQIRINSDEAKIKKYEQTLERKQKQIKNMEEYKIKNEEKLLLLEDQLKSKQRENHRLSSQRKSLELELTNTSQQLMTTISKREDESKLSMLINLKNQELSNILQLNKNYQNELTSREEQLYSKTKQIKILEDRIKQQEGQLKEKIEKVDCLGKQVGECKNKIVSLNYTNEKYLQEISQQRQENEKQLAEMDKQFKLKLKDELEMAQKRHKNIIEKQLTALELSHKFQLQQQRLSIQKKLKSQFQTERATIENIHKSQIQKMTQNFKKDQQKREQLQDTMNTLRKESRQKRKQIYQEIHQIMNKLEISNLKGQTDSSLCKENMGQNSVSSPYCSSNFNSCEQQLVFLQSHVYHLKLLAMNKNMQSKLGEQYLKQQYKQIYKKYQKYKQAFLSCKSKLQKQNALLINDRKFTQNIIVNCRRIVVDSSSAKKEHEI